MTKVIAIYARENGQGMAFPAASASQAQSPANGGSAASGEDGSPPPPTSPAPTRPQLKRIK